ncbi:DUF4143 domain-containing protein [Gulosibacter chungangensis]|uniref:DUF4143 domain-containing protein n=1 Tax=Gulosibacter chungangensis TaxID=979746 RepID=UPI0017878A4C|nr:DUF4143 domain-containing protein [Gulosibacter chungangensis]
MSTKALLAGEAPRAMDPGLGYWELLERMVVGGWPGFRGLSTSDVSANLMDYLAALERIFAVEDQPAWSAHLRSGATLRKEPKRHFADPSLAAAALGVDVDGLMADPAYTGQLFESLVVQHLRVFAQPLRGVVCHARNSYGREVDAVVQLPDRAWAGFEVKLGASPETVELAAESLKRFAEQTETPPVSLTVVTSSGPSYRRPDGINVVAIGALAP